MAGDGSAVKSEPSITPTVRAAKLSKITHSGSGTEQNSQRMRVQVKVKVKWMKTVDTVHSTLSLFKSKSKSAFSEELQSAKLSLSYK